jgi:hypothetical protein
MSPARGLRFEPVGSGAAHFSRLGGYSASTRRLNGGNIPPPPHSLGGCSPDLCDGRGWTVAPTGDKGQMNVWGSTAPDDQRLQASRGSAWLSRWRRTRHRRRVRRPPRDRRLCRESELGRSEPS